MEKIRDAICRHKHHRRNKIPTYLLIRPTTQETGDAHADHQHYKFDLRGFIMSATSASGSSLTSLSRRRSRCQMSRVETSQTSVFTPFTRHLPESFSRVGDSSSCNGLSWASVRNSLVAGYAAGVCGTLIGHPLDSIKVWIQTKSSLQRHSLQCLYRGVSVPLVTVGFIQCINFGIYDASLRLLLSDQQPPPGYSAADASPMSL
jgi:Mitochondrial carrier protein